MKMLITGGAGFIGLNFIQYTLMKHPRDEIVCFDKLTYAANSAEVKKLAADGKIEFVKGDIADRAELDNLFCSHTFDAVVNFAAETHVDRSIKSPEIFVKTNVTGVQVLLDMCLKYNVPRFHQVSTDEVYGAFSPRCGQKPFCENAALCPASPYSATKAAADLLALSYFKTYGLAVTVERSANNYGAHQHPEKLIPLAVSRALAGRQIPLYGTGENRRCWLFVGDHCRATDLILRGGTAGGIYNIAPENEKANIDVVRDILKRLGKSESLITFVKDRAGHDMRYKINSSKMEAEFGWHAETDFETGLCKTIEWYAEHRLWLDKITASPRYKKYFSEMYGAALTK